MMKGRGAALLLIWLGAAQASQGAGTGSSGPSQTELVSRGEYVLRAAGCVTCHTDTENDGPFLGGGPALKTPLGTFYAPNITPHPEHGIGDWSVDDLDQALRAGVSPAGRHYYPVFPYTSYTRMPREDIVVLKAYLDTVKPVDRLNRAHELPWYLFRPLVWFWKWLYFEPGSFEANPEKSAAWNRGAYLVEGPGHCAECHSPRNRFGAIVEEMRFAGTRDGPEEEVVPNITPHRDTGIGGWARGDVVHYLRTGADPNGDYAGGLMADVIDDNLSHLRKEDVEAMVAYLLSLQPIEHKVKDEKEERKGGDAFYY